MFRGTTQVGTSATTTFTDTGLTPNTTYSYTVRATDAAGNQSAPSNSASATTGPPVPDTQPPTAPTNLVVSSKTSTTVSLAWGASTDNVGVTGYRIREGTTQVGTSTSTAFTVTGLAPVSTHSYNVVAVDAAGNVSPASNTVTVTTDPVGTASLKVQYRAADSSATDQQIKPHLNIVNTGTTAVPLSELTVRYWYTRDGTQPQVYDCDFAVPGCANITAGFVTLSAPVATADTYLQLSFGCRRGHAERRAPRRARSRTGCTTRTGAPTTRRTTTRTTPPRPRSPTGTASPSIATARWSGASSPTGTAPDTQPPTAPGALAVERRQPSTTIALSWTGVHRQRRRRGLPHPRGHDRGGHDHRPSPSR